MIIITTVTCTQLVDQPPSCDVAVMYSCSRGASLGRSRNMWRVERSTGMVPLNLQRGLMSSVGFSRLPQVSHWSPRAS